MKYNYYEDELSRLGNPDVYGYAVQVRGPNGKTKWMNINSDSSPTLIKFIEKLKK